MKEVTSTEMATMKLKLWKFELEFDEKDAKIMIPIVLGGLASKWEIVENKYNFLALLFYYLFYFYLNSIIEKGNQFFKWIKFKCPSCKSRKIILQGYQSYKSDEQHAFYLCTQCSTTSMLTEGGLTHK